MKQLFVKLGTQLDYAICNNNYLAMCGSYPITQASMSSFLSLCTSVQPDELVVLYNGLFSINVPTDAKVMYDIPLGQNYHCMLPEKDFQKMLEFGRALKLQQVRFVGILGFFTSINKRAVLLIREEPEKVVLLTVDRGLIKGVSTAPAEKAISFANYILEAMNAVTEDDEQPYTIVDLNAFENPYFVKMCLNADYLTSAFERQIVQFCMYANSEFASDFTAILPTGQSQAATATGKIEDVDEIQAVSDDEFVYLGEVTDEELATEFLNAGRKKLPNRQTKPTTAAKRKDGATKAKQKTFSTLLICIGIVLVIAAVIFFATPYIKDMLNVM